MIAFRVQNGENAPLVNEKQIAEQGVPLDVMGIGRRDEGRGQNFAYFSPVRKLPSPYRNFGESWLI